VFVKLLCHKYCSSHIFNLARDARVQLCRDRAPGTYFVALRRRHHYALAVPLERQHSDAPRSAPDAARRRSADRCTCSRRVVHLARLPPQHVRHPSPDINHGTSLRSSPGITPHTQHLVHCLAPLCPSPHSRRASYRGHHIAGWGGHATRRRQRRPTLLIPWCKLRAARPPHVPRAASQSPGAHVRRSHEPVHVPPASTRAAVACVIPLALPSSGLALLARGLYCQSLAGTLGTGCKARCFALPASQACASSALRLDLTSHRALSQDPLPPPPAPRQFGGGNGTTATELRRRLSADLGRRSRHSKCAPPPRARGDGAFERQRPCPAERAPTARPKVQRALRLPWGRP